MHSLLTSEHALRTPCCDPAFFGYRTDSGVFDLPISAASRGAAAPPATQRANSAQQRSQPPSRDLLGVSRLGHEGMPLEKQRRRPFYAVFFEDRLGQRSSSQKQPRRPATSLARLDIVFAIRYQQHILLSLIFGTEDSSSHLHTTSTHLYFPHISTHTSPHTKGLHLHKRMFVIPIRCLVFSLIVPASEAVEIIVTLSG